MKLTCSLNGRQIGKRTTDRRYTHCVAMVAFNPDAYRCAHLRYEPGYDREAESEWVLYRVLMSTPIGMVSAETTLRYGRREQVWPFPVKQDHKDSAAKYLAGCETLGQFLAMKAARRAARLEEIVEGHVERGDCILSWHANVSLAHKARAAAERAHPGYTLVILPVDPT